MKKNTNVNEKDFTQKELISICVDIRKSTKLHEKVNNLQKTSDIVSTFISSIYDGARKENENFVQNVIYSGDGIIFVIFTEQKNNFQKVCNLVFYFKNIILEFEEKYSEYTFEAGIGVDFGKSGIQKVKNIKSIFNNTLYVGDPISWSTKLCVTVPLSNSRYKIKRHIALSSRFYNMLDPLNKNRFIMTKTNKKAVERIGEEN